MKTFEEWWKVGRPGGRGRCYGEEACELAWKAALEWALAQGPDIGIAIALELGKAKPLGEVSDGG